MGVDTRSPERPGPGEGTRASPMYRNQLKPEVQTENNLDITVRAMGSGWSPGKPQLLGDKRWRRWATSRQRRLERD